MPSYDMPQTPNAAPPNLYSRMASMKGAGSAGTAADGSTSPGPGDDDFTKMLAQTLEVLGKFGAMPAVKSKPAAQKYLDAASKALKDCMTVVFNKNPDSSTPTPGSGAEGASGGEPGPPPITPGS